MASRAIAKTVGLWKALGNLETSTLTKDLHDYAIVKPVFVCGLARSGSTILTELISQHPYLACHHYSDFPVTWIPYWWNSLRRQLPLPKRAPQERAHRDRLMITADSPEAIEEVLWMHFFPAAHKPDCVHLMSAEDDHAQFEKYYREHILKLLAVSRRQRYVAKNNYHVTRLEYLLKLFPDARFVIPVRQPRHHIASLIKQHRLFSQQNTEDPRVSRQLQLSGHYEFGPRRCPIVVSENRRAYYGGDRDDLAWYAGQWADVYGYLHERMQKNQALADACRVVHYEDLCSDTSKTLREVFAHLDLDDESARRIIAAHSPTITAPDYYQADYSAEQEDLIRQITGTTAERFAYRKA